ncbi:MAG TPA: hypothetical protein VFV67_26930 [Actinophytocola sp.]|uniref:hypothetical protein n=1 Tax=Actinophytocola sp. TaxID=1872138 RepID=UPI002DBBBBE7|nr:hypothetical protein [Actinophytocola sp.]HEU5474299.1 hypothetical protein [Actinophytocola sp.]
MGSGLVPVLWLSGPPGVGKTTVGWEIYTQLVGSGLESGYVDIDQLGMYYPEPAADPGRHWLKARNLGAVVAGFRAAGARCVVVSGVLDPGHEVPAGAVPDAVLTVCRLRADGAELRRRLAARRLPIGEVERALREADELDTGAVAGGSVDTTGLPVADVARLVRDRTGWPVPSGPNPSPAPVRPAGPDADGRVLWLCGPTAAGKSAVGFAVYQKVLRSGRTAAYLDLDQIGFRGPTPAGHPVRAGIMATIWRTYRQAGARDLVVVGPVEDEAAFAVYSHALPATRITLLRLHAGRDQLTNRILSRGQGSNWTQPGDPLVGKPIPHLLRIADHAAGAAEAFDRTALGHRIDTDHRTVEEVAAHAFRWSTR